MQRILEGDVPQPLWPALLDRVQTPIGVYRSPGLDHVYANPAFTALVGEPSSAAHRELLEQIARDESLESWGGFTFHSIDAHDGRFVAVVAEDLGGEGERRFRDIFERAGVGVAQIGLHGSFQQVNVALAEMLGYSVEELHRMTYMQVSHPDDSRADRARASELMRGERAVYESERRCIRPDGTFVWVLWTTSLVRTEEGTPAHFVVVVRDVNQRRRLDEERMRLLDQLEESRRLSEALNDVDTLIHSSLDVREVMDLVVRAAAEGMGTEASMIVLYQGDGEWEIVSAHGLPASWNGRRFGEDVMPHFRDVRRNEQSTVVGGPFEHVETGHPGAEGRALLQPLRLREQFLGVVDFVSMGGPPFTELQRDYAAKVANALSLAIENARLYEREHHIAETLQESLLALPDRVNEFDLASAYRSAVEAARVGGDLYDAFETYDGRVCLVVGDISGKGLDAAVLTSLVRNTLRAYAVEPGVSPDEVVSRLNAAVYAQTSTEMFVTLFMALIEPFDGSMAYCNAAHPAPFIRRVDGTLSELPGNSPLVGAFPAVRFLSSNAVIDDGDILLLYTDGVLESRSGAEMFGEARIGRILAEEHEDIQSIVDTLLSAVAAFSDQTFTDDIAVLVAQRSKAARTRRQRQQRMDLGHAV